MSAALEPLALQVVIPVLDLRGGDGRPAPAAALEAARDLARRGVGGFILFGGDIDTLAADLAALRAAAPRGLLVAADLERGLGQQVRGGAHLPPLLALGAADDEDLARRAGEAVAREALAVGVDWLLGPVLDLADEPRNPIVGTRSLGPDPARVAALGAAVIEGVQAAGGLACAKHFPGHGATTDDSHAALPVVQRPADALRARDLAPFRRAVAAGVASVMSAHVVYPTLSSTGRPATLDPTLVQGLLREELGFEGLVVTDALIMDGVLVDRAGEGESACLALEAGCDALLYPKDPLAVAAAVAAWAAADPAREARQIARLRRLAA
ncbi:MAG: glycosyl hydrolase family 3, partial [Planctomycetes bacterium]|nr:glycosyl hydrolase family 3 [Planctomycetota bacterium]